MPRHTTLRRISALHSRRRIFKQSPPPICIISVILGAKQTRSTEPAEVESQPAKWRPTSNHRTRPFVVRIRHKGEGFGVLANGETGQVGTYNQGCIPGQWECCVRRGKPPVITGLGAESLQWERRVVPGAPLLFSRKPAQFEVGRAPCDRKGTERTFPWLRTHRNAGVIVDGREVGSASFL